MLKVNTPSFCVFCGEKSLHTLPCNLCKEVLCANEATYIAIVEETYEGNRTKVLRICPDCKEKRLRMYRNSIARTDDYHENLVGISNLYIK